MSKEKQIEEMAKVIEGKCNRDCIPSCDECIAQTLYNAGYRKQSEGEWIKEHIYSRNWDDHYNLACSVCGAVIIDAPKEYKYCHECGAKMKGCE